MSAASDDRTALDLRTAPLIPGAVSTLSPLVRRILAPNPNFMTGPGTNTYLVGHDEIAVIDPGPDDPRHVDALLAAGGDRIRWIICTHSHADHWPAAVPLAARTGAEVLGFDPRDGLVVDRTLVPGERVAAADFTLRALHTPGHVDNHLSFLLEQEGLLFAGDHLMQGSSVVILPPHGGNMGAYVRSLQELLTLDPPLRTIAPGHGLLFTEPVTAIEQLVAHRLEREGFVLAALRAAHGPSTIDELMPVAYPQVPEPLAPIARLTLWAHLLKLVGEQRVRATDPDELDASRWEFLR